MNPPGRDADASAKRKPPSEASREARLAKALRDNLRRRKADKPAGPASGEDGR